MTAAPGLLPEVSAPEQLRSRAGRAIWRRVVRTPLPDGVILVADLYTDGPEMKPAPVLLERTPYGRRQRRTSDGRDRDGYDITPVDGAAHFVAAGLHVMRQDTRGRGDSGGEFVKYLPEAQDGFDTVQWVGNQEWCDGRVATMGVSYSAHTQTALAALGPDKLAAMFLDSGGMASAYETGVRDGGAFELKQATWAYRHALSSRESQADLLVKASLEEQDLAGWFTAMPWRRGLSPLRSVPGYESYLLDQWHHSDFSPYWQHPSLYARGHYGRFPDVPTVHLCSWYDPYVRAAIENFQELSVGRSRRSYLVLGPWTHGARSETFAGDVDFGSSAALDGSLAADYLEFRSNFLRRQLGLDDLAMDMPAVQYFLMGGGPGGRNVEGRLNHGGRWQTADRWPPAGAAPRRWYLVPGGVLAPTPGNGEMVEYPADPADPVPTRGGAITSGEPVMVGGAFDQTCDSRTFGAQPPYLPLTSRPDVVSFSTAPLPRAVAIVGPVTVALRFSSSAPDTDVTVKLVDEYPPSSAHPNGFAMNITDTVLRCRYRNGFDRGIPLVPGVAEQITIRAPDTANLFAKGHRIRLDIASSNFPRFDVNPNTGAEPGSARHGRRAINTLHLDEGCHLELSEVAQPTPE